MNRLVLLLGLVIAASSGGGCAALTNPSPTAFPCADCRTRCSAGRETELQQVPLNLLRINDPGDYKLDKGDVLAIVADEVAEQAEPADPGPVHPESQLDQDGRSGLPVPVQDDGNIILPLLDPIDVRGKTLPQVRELIIDQMRTKELVPRGKKAGPRLSRASLSTSFSPGDTGCSSSARTAQP